MQSTQPKQSTTIDHSNSNSNPNNNNNNNNRNRNTTDNNNEHTINEQSLRPQSIKNHNHRHCERHENELQRRKKRPSMHCSISSVESQQIINCDECTVKVNIAECIQPWIFSRSNRPYSYTPIYHPPKIDLNKKKRKKQNQPTNRYKNIDTYKQK